MAKTLIFYHDPNNPASTAMREAVVASGVAFTELNLASDFRKHNVSRGGPLVLVDIDGANLAELSPNADGASIAATFNATAAPAAKPIAKIITKDALGSPQTLFTSAQTITVRAEIWKPDNSGVLTTFSGTYPVPFFDSNNKEHYMKLTFTNGVAEITIAAGKLQPSKYRATKASSTLADVVPHEIIVALNGA